jgi:DNA-binding CsgD family transcriptional regulator
MLQRRSIAFLFKPVTSSELLTLISNLTERPKQQLILPRTNGGVNGYATAFHLTRRERAVLDHCIAGLGREETAAQLGISIGTVHRTWMRILARTGNATQDALLRQLIRHVAEVPIRATTSVPSRSK